MMPMLAALRTLLSRIRASFVSRRSEEDEAEIQGHLDLLAERFERQGMSPEEAAFAARKQFGGVTRTKENLRERRALLHFDVLLQDLKHAFRQIKGAPGFTATAALTLALGIGATTAVFSVVNSVLLKPLPYPQPRELVALRQLAPGAGGLSSVSDGLLLSPSMYFTYAERNRSFQSLGVWVTDTANVTSLGQPEQVRTVLVSNGVLQALRVPPALGRWLSRANQIPNGPKAVMLSYGYWQRQFGGDPSVIGRNITVDGQSRQIVGVMPRGFRVVNADFDLIVPLALETAPETVYWPSMMKSLYGSHSLDADRTVAYAIRSNRAGTASFLNEIRKAVWSVNASLPVASARTMQDIFDQSTARTSFTLVMVGIAGAMAFVLGIVGIYGVISYAVSQRRHEIGIRLALGAPQANIRRMFVRSGLSLAGIGVAIGLVTAIAVTGLMKSLLFGISQLDPATYAGASLVLTAATVLASYLPAHRAAALDPVEVLKAE
ncbi:MAG TPA: ABC transporter permease [Bryobacteraceae bacterium]